jgi:hypothetical protein
VAEIDISYGIPANDLVDRHDSSRVYFVRRLFRTSRKKSESLGLPNSLFSDPRSTLRSLPNSKRQINTINLTRLEITTAVTRELLHR